MSQDVVRNHQLFESWARNEGYPHFQSTEYREVLLGSPLLRIPHQKVLDVGCGVGMVAAQLKALEHQVTGLDFSAAALQVALHEERIDSAIASDVLSADLAPESFDVVICWGVLMLLFDLQPVLKKLHGSIRPGGQILFFDHHARNPYTRLHFSRPDWVDRWLEGQSNLPRHAFYESDIVDISSDLFEWGAPRYHTMFTHHPHPVINTVHSAARFVFDGLRSMSQARWTGNFLSLVGTKL